MWPPRKPMPTTQATKLVITRSCKPRRLPWRVARMEPMYTPNATNAPNGLIEKGTGGKPPNAPFGTIVSSGMCRYGIAGALNTARLLPHSPPRALVRRLLGAIDGVALNAQAIRGARFRARHDQQSKSVATALEDHRTDRVDLTARFGQRHGQRGVHDFQRLAQGLRARLRVEWRDRAHRDRLRQPRHQ